LKRLRVLISSHEFSPYQGSECAVGWNIATRLAAYHDVTVLCADGPAGHRDAYRNAVSHYFDTHGRIPGLNVVFVTQPGTTIRLARANRLAMQTTGGIGWQVLYYIGLDAWHKAAFDVARRLGLSSFDVVHQLTPISFRRPGFFFKSGRPFFWGPVGGMSHVPVALARSGGWKSHVFEKLRSLSIEKDSQSQRLREVVSSAARIWAVTGEECRIMNEISPGKAVTMIDAAPPSHLKGYVRTFVGDKPLRLCFSGEHMVHKALPLLLHALAQLPKREAVHLTVLGDGPERRKWMTLASVLGLRNISWEGRLSYEDALQAMGKCDVLVHPSFREATSMVILEALGLGMPVICHDAYGMKIAVNETCGITVPFENASRSVVGFRDAIVSLLDKPESVGQLSEGALRRAVALSWDVKAQEIATAYHTASVAPPPSQERAS